jgi:ribose 5-phosphate isomerase B
MKKEVRVYIGSDHAGFKVKQKIKEYLKMRGIAYEDISPELIEGDDYPDYAFKVAEKVSRSKDSRGILVCGTGSGMCIAANKIKGIRAATIYDKYSATMSRKDNNVNVACLRARRFFPRLDIRLIDLWLNTEFSHEERHKRRLAKIEKYEK